MIHQHLEYQRIKEGFDTETSETENTEAVAAINSEAETAETVQKANTKVFKDIGSLLIFYGLFIIIFMVSGSLMFKYIIVTRIGKSIVGDRSCFPVSLNYRKRDVEYYPTFFKDGKEALLHEQYECDYFTYSTQDETTKKDQKSVLPINFSYSPYYDNWLYRSDFNTGVPGILHSLDTDMGRESSVDGAVDPAKLSNTFPTNWFWPTFTSIFLSINYIFTNYFSASVTTIIVLLLALSNTISMATTSVSGTSLITSIFYPFIVLVYPLLFILSFTSLFWIFNLLYYYEKKNIFSRIKIYNIFDLYWIDLPISIILVIIMLWIFLGCLCFNFLLITSQFLPLMMIGIFINWISSESYGNYTYNGKTKELDFANILFELFPIYCLTNRWIIFFMIFAFIMLASAINPTLGSGVFICMFFGSFIYYKSINTMIKSLLSKLLPKKESDIPKGDSQIEPEVVKPISSRQGNAELTKIQEQNRINPSEIIIDLPLLQKDPAQITDTEKPSELTSVPQKPELKNEPNAEPEEVAPGAVSRRVEEKIPENSTKVTP